MRAWLIQMGIAFIQRTFDRIVLLLMLMTKTKRMTVFSRSFPNHRIELSAIHPKEVIDFPEAMYHIMKGEPVPNQSRVPLLGANNLFSISSRYSSPH
jgi:hypothetical protein